MAITNREVECDKGVSSKGRPKKQRPNVSEDRFWTELSESIFLGVVLKKFDSFGKPTIQTNMTVCEWRYGAPVGK